MAALKFWFCFALIAFTFSATQSRLLPRASAPPERLALIDNAREAIKESLKRKEMAENWYHDDRFGIAAPIKRENALQLILVQPEETVGALISQTIITQLQFFPTSSTPPPGANTILQSNKRDGTSVHIHTRILTHLYPGKPVDRGNAIIVEPLITLAAAVVPPRRPLSLQILLTDLTEELILTAAAALCLSGAGCGQQERVRVECVANGAWQQGASDVQVEIGAAAAAVADSGQGRAAAAALFVSEECDGGRHEEEVVALVRFVGYCRSDEGADNIQGEVAGFARVCKSIAPKMTTLKDM
ncbi:hypothetical protein SASPL_146296 [Salvia splendens]|uniref:Uncharacterized protein n=1 Tax=Salvia splendens TaxID=180675 RepID=A0A8X8Z5K8_SALSN|nr:hypothetical protein SASPL_146296 [Salvia splendens]